MRLVLTQDLNRVLNTLTEDEIHHETQGTRITYDTESFSLSAELPKGNDTGFKYEAYDVSDKEVTLTADQETIVLKFVKALHDTEKDKQDAHKAQF